MGDDSVFEVCDKCACVYKPKYSVENNCCGGEKHMPMVCDSVGHVTALIAGLYYGEHCKSGWKICSNCSVLFLIGQEDEHALERPYCFVASQRDLGIKADQYSHDQGPGKPTEYAVWNVSTKDLMALIPPHVKLLPNFRFCNACGCLYYADSDNQVCSSPPAYERNGKHTPGRYEYALQHASEGKAAE